MSSNRRCHRYCCRCSQSTSHHSPISCTWRKRRRRAERIRRTSWNSCFLVLRRTDVVPNFARGLLETTCQEIFGCERVDAFCSRFLPLSLIDAGVAHQAHPGWQSSPPGPGFLGEPPRVSKIILDASASSWRFYKSKPMSRTRGVGAGVVPDPLGFA
jgi:hypothetical protein